MPTRREQKRAKHEAKRKEKRKEAARQSAPRSLKSLLTTALNWPVAECWANKDWKDSTKLNQVVVARRNPATGEIYAGMYLVDRACLGVKDAYAANFASMTNFHRELIDKVKQRQGMTKVDFNLAAAIVKAGLEYAASLDLHPHRDYREASILLRDAEPDALVPTVPVGGPEGKPFFVAGPYDNTERIMAHLMRRLGPEGFHYLMPMGPDMEFMDMDEEEFEDWEIVEPDDDGVIDVESREI
ncbi:MAG TPA: hypothetical protein PKH77_19215 [Anaerolineae bacterium]|nr:hypothetical protein [Anaerolineae bacterium]